MGAAPSSPTSDAHSPPTLALHVLRVAPGSPASQTSLEPFFDFIVGLSGFDASATDITQDAALDELEALVARGLPLELIVWSSKTREKRLVPVIPAPSGQLGLSMRVCRPGAAHDNVWHVLDVLEGSPAESAGLVPFGDWIVGWSGGPLCAETDLYEVVEAHIEKPLRMALMCPLSTLREVVLVPNRQWGGEGLLGCVFGYVVSSASCPAINPPGAMGYPRGYALTNVVAPERVGAKRLHAASSAAPTFGILHRIPIVPTSASALNTVVFRPASDSGSGSGVVVNSDREEEFVY
ncbi:hypothetical protein AURDEDRAFT_165926 [Auricularia subglabra TFB-10046 SS5]|nr:hypothetical protein AURDEDRAFT_165926 [Auricularia subglabra TFB-10046 SS5]